MKITTRIIATTGLVCIGSVSANAFIISTQTPTAYTCEQCQHLPHESLSTHWPIVATNVNHVTQHEQLSKKYSFRATYKALEQGVNIYTEGPAAVIRITAVATNKDKTAAAFKPNFYIQTPQNKQLTIKEASSLIADTDDLNNSYFAHNTQAILQLKPELGAGQFTLMAEKATGHEDETFVINKI